MIKKGLSRLVIFFLYLLSLLPLWLLYLLADVIYVVLYFITGYRRDVVAMNLRNSFPEKSEAELHIIEKKYYRYLADLIVETVKVISISEKQVMKRVHVTNPELIANYYKQGRSVIAAVGHYGNWELCIHRLGLVPDYKKLMVFKPLTNKIADSYYQKIRSRFGVEQVAMKVTLRKFAALKNELSFAVLAADQTPVQHEAHYFTRFLNQDTAFFTGPEKIGTMFNSVVVFGKLKYLKRGYYAYTFVPLAEEPKKCLPNQITELYVKNLEDMIASEPQYWLWSHRRWKFKPEGTR